VSPVLSPDGRLGVSCAHAGSMRGSAPRVASVAVTYQHPLAYVLAVEGAALLRAFAGEHDRDFTLARIAEVRAFAEAADAWGDGVTWG
jgi:hypothetical protein